MRFFAIITAAVALLAGSTAAAPHEKRTWTFVGGHCHENAGPEPYTYCSAPNQLMRCMNNVVNDVWACNCQSTGPNSAACM